MGARLRGLFTGSALVAVLVVISAVLWLDQPLNWPLLVGALVSGAAGGSILAIAASGVAISYATSGIFNFASGAIGMFMAFLYWELRVNQEWPTLLCLVIVVGIAAPALGAALDGLLMRRLRDAPLTQQLVATVGVMLALMGLAGMVWPPTQSRSVPPFFGDAGFRLAGGVFVTWHRLTTIAAAALVAVLLWWLLKHTKSGLSMRAVVTHPDLAELYGVSSGRASMVSWAVGSSTAAVAGILLAPDIPLGVATMTLLILDAFAAVVIGRLTNLPLVFAGGLFVGLLNSFAITFLDLSGRWSNVHGAVPAIVLFVALLVVPPAVQQARRTPRLPPTASPVPATATATMFGMSSLLAVMVAAAWVLPTVTVSRLTQAMSLAVIMLSLVLLTGWAGETSLAQMTFAGFGAFAMLKFAGESGAMWGLLGAALVGALVGLLVALPALRLQGLYLALGSLAIARIAEILVFPQPEFFVAASGAAQFAPITVGGWQADSPGERLILVTAAFALLGLGVVLLRRSRFGLRLLALRDSPDAYAAVGLNVKLSRVAVYVASAALAGLGGALFGVVRNDVGTADFTLLGSLLLLLLLVVGGIATVGGALVGALLGVNLMILADAWPSAFVSGLTVLGPGLAAIGVSQSPGGVAGSFAQLVRELLPAWLGGRSVVAASPESHLVDLGLTRKFSSADVSYLDDELGLPEGYRGAVPRR